MDVASASCFINTEWLIFFIKKQKQNNNNNKKKTQWFLMGFFSFDLTLVWILSEETLLV